MTIAIYRFRLLLICGFCCTLLACAAVHPPAAGDAAGGGKPARRVVIGGKDNIVPGAVITHYMDRQARALQPLAETLRTGDGIIVTLSGKFLFHGSRDELQPRSRTLLVKIAAILRRYDQTHLTVVGHTDDRGFANFNIHLSERRAQVVADALVDAGLSRRRIRIMGMGFARPVAGNDSAAGRERNRRVEIHIAPDDKLRRTDRAPAP